MRKLSLLSLLLILVSATFFSQIKNKKDIVTDNLSVKLDTLELKKDSLSLNWMPTIGEALRKSKEEKKPVLIYFTGSDWCTPCIVLDKELFHTKRFKKIADDKLVLYMADSPRNSEHMSLDVIDDNNLLQYNHKINGFPTLLFVDHNGKKVALKRGYNIAQYYYPFIESVLNKYK